MSIQCIWEAYITPLMPVIAVLVAFLLGRSAYYRQKEYELITERYLKDGLDRMSKQVERSIAIFRHNWAHSLTVVKLYRDAGKDMNKELYKTGYLDPETELFEFWVDYRVRDLIGHDITNQARQLLDAFVRNSYAFFKEDLCTAVRLGVEGGEEYKITSRKKKVVAEYFEELKKLDSESQRYYELLGVLQRLASVLQTERFSFKKIKKFRDSEVVKECVGTLVNFFGEDSEEKSDGIDGKA